MNRLSKVFLIVIIILLIALGIMTYLYFNMRGIAKEHLDAYVRAAKGLYELSYREANDERTIEYVKAIENPEQRKAVINIFIENGELTQDVANELY